MIEHGFGVRSARRVFADHIADELFCEHRFAVRILLSELPQVILMRQDVELPLDEFAKRMAALRDDVVEHAAKREDVYRSRLRSNQHALNMNFRNNFHLSVLTVLCFFSISGAIHPSVPVTPDRSEKLDLPWLSFLQSPKSEIIALTSFLAFGSDSSTFCGLISR